MRREACRDVGFREPEKGTLEWECGDEASDAKKFEGNFRKIYLANSPS